jgi:hypothetical protein
MLLNKVNIDLMATSLGSLTTLIEGRRGFSIEYRNMDQCFTTPQTNPINHIHPANCHSNNYCGELHANQLSRCKPNKQRP